MSVIARLSAYLFADSAEFESGMKRAEKSLLSFKNVFKVTIEGEAIVQGFKKAAEAVKFLTEEQFRNIDAQAKLARSLNFTYQDFSALSLVAKEAGVEQTSLTKAITNTQRAL